MFYRKTFKFWNERINACWTAFTQQQEANKNMSKQIDRAMKALEETVYPAITEDRERMNFLSKAFEKIQAKLSHKKGSK